MRLKSEVFVKAYLRIAAVSGAPAMLVRRGDADAGAIFISVNRLDGTSDLYGPAPAGGDDTDVARRFVACFANGTRTDEQVRSYLSRQIEMDPDIWVIDVEDRNARHFLDDWLLKT